MLQCRLDWNLLRWPRIALNWSNLPQNVECWDYKPESLYLTFQIFSDVKSSLSSVYIDLHANNDVTNESVLLSYVG